MKRPLLTLALAVAFSGAFAQKAPKTKTKVKMKQKQEAVQVPAAGGVAQERVITVEDFAATITAGELREHLQIIASDEYEGRETGERGQKMAAEYISEYFRNIGLRGPVENSDNPYYQVFELERSVWDETYLRTGSKTYSHLKDFYILGNPPYQQETPLQLVFAGYGIDDKNYSDYRNLDVKGKTVVVLAGEPLDAKSQSLITRSAKASAWAIDWRRKVRTAKEKGAHSVLIITGDTDKEFSSILDRLSHYLTKSRLEFKAEDAQGEEESAVFVSPALGAALLNTSQSSLQKYKGEVKKKGQQVAGKFRPVKNAVLKASRKRETVTTENVLGYLEGTERPEELIVITAHYDHIGIIDGKIYNGADDDGSGTVAIMELAQAFVQAKEAGAGPKRSVLFMAVTAEEKGLLGSEYYVNHPVFPLEHTVANFNIDMIGRIDEKYGDNPDYIYLIGSDKLSSELHKISEEMNRKYTQLELDYTYNEPDDPNRFYYRSDHYNFAKNKIPVIFYFNGVHEDYHQHTDEVEKINFEKMEKIAKLIFHTAWEVANRDERIVVDSNKE